MDNKQRLQLQNMIKANGVENYTDLIRELKHSQVLRNEVNKLIVIKAKYRGDSEKIHLEGVNDCNFLFTYYTDIYNKLRKDELDIHILNKLLDVLKKIEDGELDQHEGSFIVGSVLKELYVDSALKKGDKLNENNEVIAVPQFQMQYSDQSGPGGSPNNQVQQNSKISTQQNANAVYDKAALTKGGKRKRRTRKGGNADWKWGCYSGGKKKSKTRRRPRRKTRRRR